MELVNGLQEGEATPLRAAVYPLQEGCSAAWARGSATWEGFLLSLQENCMFQPSCSLGDAFIVHFVVTSASERCLCSSLPAPQSSVSARAGCSQICFKLEYVSSHNHFEHMVCASFVGSVPKQIRKCSRVFSTSREEEELPWERTMTCTCSLHLHKLSCFLCT